MPTLQCLSRDALKEYLSGWTDAEQSDAIESHLTQCSDCEQTIVALESDPETLIEFVRNSRNSAAAEAPDSAIAYALSRAKKLSTESDEPVAPWQPPTGEFGPYELLRPLGHGGMASVYLARHRQLGKQVAIKLLPSRSFRNDHYAARFQREIRTAGQLNHPAIVSATDAGEQAGTHYLVMEYIDGLDLSRVARLNGPLPIADACAIMRTVAIGLSHAHAEGIVHRDIKPSNLMLSSAGDVKILDFGLAQVNLWDEASAELTTVGQLMGTLDYMAPEQAERPEAVDYRADLYSIGATLFRLLCGRAPLAAAPDLSPLVKLRLLASHQPPRLDTLRTDAPEKLVEFVAELLARNPADRPASAAHVAEQLAQFTESADLKSLITTAQSKSHQEPATKSLLTLPPAVATQPALSGGGRRISRWLLAASLLPLFILAGVLITLETQKGQLVIESESANVEVKLLRDGEFYEKLKIVPGVNSTRLYAGKYEVVIDGGSDSFSFDQPEIEITRGNTVVARVRRDASMVNAVAPAIEPNAPATTGPVFEGKSLKAWLDVFERERSPEERSNSLWALHCLATEDEAKAEILPVLLRVKPAGFQNTDDRLHFATLLECVPERQQFFEILARELDKKNEDYCERIIDYLTGAIREKKLSDSEEFAPVRNWIIANVFKSNTSDSLLQRAVRLFVDLQQWSAASDSQRQGLIDDLLGCDRLGFEFWLSSPEAVHRDNFSGMISVPWTRQYAAAVESKAVEALSSPKTDAMFVVQALIILDVVHSAEFKKHNLNPSIEQAQLLNALKVQVDRVASEDGFALQMLPLNRSFASFAQARWRDSLPIGSLTTLPCRLSGLEFSDYQTANMGLEILQSLRLLNFGQQALPLCKRMLEVTGDGAHRFALAASYPYANTKDIYISWPTLSFKVDDKLMSQSEVLSYLIFDSAFSLLPAADQQRLKAEHLKRLKLEWFDSVVKKLDEDADGKLSYDESILEFNRPTLLPYQADAAFTDTNRDQFISAQELFDYFERAPAKAEIASDAKEPTKPAEPEPIYEGKPLSDWLRLFELELSPSGSGKALEAIAAMLSDSSSKRVETTLLKVLKSSGDRWIDYNRQSSSLDEAVFPQLARCYTTRKEYFKMLSKELASTDKDWGIRILRSAVHYVDWQPEDVEPVVDWIEEAALRSSQSPEMTFAAATLFVRMIRRNVSTPEVATLQNRLVDSLASSEQVDVDFWLSQQPSLNDAQFETFYPRFASTIESKAIAAIINTQSTESQVTKAALLLLDLNSDAYDRTGMEVRPISNELIQALGKRLVAQTASPEQCRACVAWHASRASQQTTRGVRPLPLIESLDVQVSVKESRDAAYRKRFNVALELLAVVKALGVQSQLKTELRAAVNSTLADAVRFADATSDWGRAQQFYQIDLDRLDKSLVASEKTITGAIALNYLIFVKAILLLPQTERSEIEIAQKMKRLDKDSSGSLSYEEAKNEIPDPAAIDTDKDQLISFQEFAQHQATDNQPADLAVVEWARKQIEKYDKNKDGKLTVDEWSDMINKPVGADANGDGAITAEEYAMFRKKKSQ